MLNLRYINNHHQITATSIEKRDLCVTKVFSRASPSHHNICSSKWMGTPNFTTPDVTFVFLTYEYNTSLSLLLTRWVCYAPAVVTAGSLGGVTHLLSLLLTR